jgi:hypothetical protein
MRLAIVGSRDFHNYTYLENLLEPIKESIEWIISGGAKGVDSLAEKYAARNFIPFLLFPANWEKYGKRAGFMRNQQIVDAADHMIALPTLESKGTRDSIRRAEVKGIPVQVFEIGGF